MGPPSSRNPKRPASPEKSPKNGTKSKTAKTLSFPDEVAMMDNDSTSGSRQDGGAHGFAEALQQPPQWFRDFESRQEVRFANIMKENKDVFEGFKMEVDNMKDEINSLKQQLELTEIKIDDLENRSRRNNIVIFNLPEGAEGPDCGKYISQMLMKECKIEISGIQRAHRTGKLNPDTDKPRPIHVGFGLYQDKELCRKALVELFKRDKIANSKLFVSNDYSQKVLKLRREKMPQLRQLKSKGKNAFFIYPATIKVREANGVVRDA